MILFNEIYEELYFEMIVNTVLVTTLLTGSFLLFISEVQSKIYSFM